MGNANAGYLILNKLDQLTNDLNTELMETPVSAQSPVNELCWIRKNGGNVGETTTFTQRLWANDTEDRNTYEEIPGRKPVIASFQVAHKEKAPDAEVIPRWTRVTDVYGIFKDEVAPDMLARIELKYARDVAAKIGAGTVETTIYDNQPFFVDTALHSAAPGRPGAPTFKNWLRNNKLDEAGLLAGLDLLDTMPAADGSELDMPGEIIVVCSNRSQYHRALKFYRGEYVEGAITANSAASKYNSLKEVARPVLFKQLRKHYSNDGWLLLKIASAKHRPFVLSFAQDGEPEIYMEGLSINDHSRVIKNVGRTGFRGGWGAGTLWPQLAVLNTENS